MWMTVDYLDWNKWKTLMIFEEKYHEYTPLSEFLQWFRISIWFPRHMFKDMVLFSAFVLRAFQFSHEFRGNQDNLIIDWKLGHLSDCSDFHKFHCENSIPLRTNAENQTISLNICPGNQIHILNHICGIFLKGVYSWFPCPFSCGVLSVSFRLMNFHVAHFQWSHHDLEQWFYKNWCFSMWIHFSNLFKLNFS